MHKNRQSLITHNEHVAIPNLRCSPNFFGIANSSTAFISIGSIIQYLLFDVPRPSLDPINRNR